MNKLCIVYNMAGVRGNESSFYYSVAINSILSQSFKDYTLVLSGCCLNETTKDNLRKEFKDRADLLFVDGLYPVTVTFNFACMRTRHIYGNFEGYLYIDSGCVFQNDDDLQKLYDGFKSHPDCGMYAAQVDGDTGYHQWFGLGRFIDDHSENYKLFENGDFRIPIGKCCNLHTQIFSDAIMEFYGRPYPDIFASHYSETVFSYVCAAIKTSYWISKDVIVHHELLDGQSSGYSPVEWKINKRKELYDHPYIVDSVMNRVGSKMARHLGLGYGELSAPEHPNGLVNHDPAQFDENGYCVNEDLKHYISDSLFLSALDLNYSNIEGTS